MKRCRRGERGRLANRRSKASWPRRSNLKSIEEEEASPCPDCHGARLNAVARHVRVQGLTIDDFNQLFGRRSART